MFSSKPFVFVIGESQTEFLVHAGIIAKQSKALDVLINGPMAEASGGKAILDDVQTDTFERFCQFAYTGNYTTPASRLVEDSPPINKRKKGTIKPFDSEAVPEPEVSDESWDSTPPSEKSKRTVEILRFRYSLRELLGSLHYKTGKTTLVTELCDVRYNSSVREDYTPIFLGHAHLYVFADKWGVTGLKNLALSKLHQTLLHFTLYDARRPDIVELVRYAYDNTPDRVGAVDELRELLTVYMGCEAESMVRCSEFLSLIGEGGKIPQDFVQMTVKRIQITKG